MADTSRPATDRLSAISAAIVAVATMASLTTVPRVVRTSPAAAATGFDASVAHLLLVAIALFSVALYGALSWHGKAGAAEGWTGPLAPPAGDEPRSPVVAVVAAIVALTVVLVYFPPFLVRYGLYGEDKYFMSVLQRMLVGQHPYSDFEFIYGPLIIQPAAAWMSLFGYSMASYYWLLALVEAVTFAVLAVGLARFLPDRRSWLLALVVTGTLLFNDNLGLSWIALRRLLPVVVLLAYATRESRPRGWPAVAALLGLQCVLSLEYALACILAIGGAAVVESAAARSFAPMARTLRTIASGVVVGAGLALTLMGGRATDWLRATWEVMILRGGGEAGFPFAPSVNAWAVLFLIFLSCARMGSGLTAVLRSPIASPRGLEQGDRFLLAALAYAMVAAKSGMARSDMYHLVPPVLGLAAAAALPLAAGPFAATRAVRRASLLAIAIIVVTYAPGLVGASRVWGEGLVRGAIDVVSGRPPSGPDGIQTRAPRIGGERTEVPVLWTDLAALLAEDRHASRPVVFYGGLWGLDRNVGVAKPLGVYPTDDYLVSDEVGLEIRSYLEATPDALIVISAEDWDVLRGVAPPPVYTSMFWLFGERSWLVRSLELWSSSHYGAAVVEEQVRKAERWARTVGSYLPDRYRIVGSADGVLVLARSGG